MAIDSGEARETVATEESEVVQEDASKKEV